MQVKKMLCLKKKKEYTFFSLYTFVIHMEEKILLAETVCLQRNFLQAHEKFNYMNEIGKNKSLFLSTLNSVLMIDTTQLFLIIFV